MLVDASVALKWYLAEDDSDAAEALFIDHALTAPELIHAEVGNGLWKAWRKGALPLRSFEAALENLTGRFSDIHSLGALAGRAAEIARTLNHPVYDCFYLACAEREARLLVTADQRLLQVVAGSAWEALCRPLTVSKEA